MEESGRNNDAMLSSSSSSSCGPNNDAMLSSSSSSCGKQVQVNDEALSASKTELGREKENKRRAVLSSSSSSDKFRRIHGGGRMQMQSPTDYEERGTEDGSVTIFTSVSTRMPSSSRGETPSLRDVYVSRGAPVNAMTSSHGRAELGFQDQNMEGENNDDASSVSSISDTDIFEGANPVGVKIPEIKRLAPKSHGNLAIHLRDLRVLIVDKDKKICTMMKEKIERFLKRKRVPNRIAMRSNGKEALEICKTQFFHIVLIEDELGAGDLNGEEVVVKLRTNIGFKGVILSLTQEYQKVAPLLEAGANSVLIKGEKQIYKTLNFYLQAMVVRISAPESAMAEEVRLLRLENMRLKLRLSLCNCMGGSSDTHKHGEVCVTGVEQPVGKGKSLVDLIDSSVSFLITDNTSKDNPITFASDSFLQVTGYTREEVIGRNCRFLQGEETDQDQVEKIRDAVKNGEQLAVKLINYTKTGVPFWNELFISPLRNDRGEVTHFVGIQKLILS